jgi:1,4-alpha-glucan branching enzyme
MIMNDFQRIVACDHHDPFTFLGCHFDVPQKAQATIRTFQPHAQKVWLLCEEKRHAMVRAEAEGLFVAVIERGLLAEPDLHPYSYRFEILYHDGSSFICNDPYRFPVLLGEEDRYLFNAGRNYRLYEHLGAHPTTCQHITGVVFRTWAPNARAVSVIGNFNGWDGRTHPMRSLGASGIWELFMPHMQIGEFYKFHLKTRDGEIVIKSDPFQFYGELRPGTASKVHDLGRYQWQDEQWLRQRALGQPYAKPLSIYEVHPGSWRRDPDDPQRFLTFAELADSLIPYAKDMGFTHLELMPVMEHPLDESWGYQVTAPYSLTSRYGTPEEFKFFVETCHRHGLGVILDWVPAHFPKDAHSLGRYDGSALYEHEDQRRGYHPEWGTYIYNYGRKEVSNYLIANALFWLEHYHVDGLRVDAVASMLYLDYSRRDGEWLPNRYGGRENLEAIEFLRHLNAIVYQRHPDVLLIAEESTSFYGVSKPTDVGGLGFGFKWNMGWMNDILDYFSKDALYRKYHHNHLTFSIMYAFAENFILPLSHDEVVHGKKSLLDKMPGDLWQKFANLRLLLLTMWLHPGKKLLFMGGEFGQWSEWYCKRSLDWHLLEVHPLHSQLKHFVTALNGLYKAQPSLWEEDCNPAGFSWLDLEDRNNSIISFARFATERSNHLVAVFNYTPQTLASYRIGLPALARYRVIFSSNDGCFGGSDHETTSVYQACDTPHAQGRYSIDIAIPPLAGVVLAPITD